MYKSAHHSRRGFLGYAGSNLLAATALMCGKSPAAMAISASAAGVDGLRRVKDFRGVTIALKQPARRVVCLIESALSGLYMLGAQSSLVGVPANVYTGDVAPHYANLDKRLSNKSLPTPGNWDFISIERVIALRPDVVIMWSQQREGIAALEARGIPVYGVFLTSIADLEKEINDLALLTGTEVRAKALLAYTKAEVDAIVKQTNKVPVKQRPKVYYAWGQGMLETSCRGSMVDDMIRLAGGENACTDKLEHGKPSLERVLQWDPDVIVLWPSERRTVASVLANSQWRNVAAIRNRRIYQLPEVFFCDLWTLKYQFALRLMAHWFHPSIFPRLPEANLRDGIFGKLYGLQAL